MSNYNYYEELKEKVSGDAINTPTMEYRINSFMEAYDMNLEKGMVEEEVNIDELREYLMLPTMVDECRLFTKKGKNSQYNVNAMIGNSNRINFINIYGNYKNSSFEYVNLYNKKIMNKEVVENPYQLKVSRITENRVYDMIATKAKGKTKFIFRSKSIENEYDRKEITFYSKRNDIENVLSILSNFVKKPEVVFTTYEKVMESKEVYFNGTEVDLVKYDENVKVMENGKKLVKSL